jgi:hypothetical protein
MTKARPRRVRNDADIDELSWRFLCDATTPEDETADESKWLMLTLRFNETTVAEPPTGKQTSQLWEEFGPSIVAWWVEENPGTRPKCWWKFTAPQPRRRLGGTGATKRDAVECEPFIDDYGLPPADGWLLAGDLRWLPYKECGHPAVDPRDPPTFESQAAYLTRLKLFEPGEENRLKPADFVPEAIIPAIKVRR